MLVNDNDPILVIRTDRCESLKKGITRAIGRLMKTPCAMHIEEKHVKQLFRLKHQADRHGLKDEVALIAKNLKMKLSAKMCQLRTLKGYGVAIEERMCAVMSLVPVDSAEWQYLFDAHWSIWRQQGGVPDELLRKARKMACDRYGFRL